MQTIDAFQAETHFFALLAQVEKGEQIIITKHGHPIVKWVPYEAVDAPLVKKQATQQLKVFAKSHSLNGLNWKKLRDEGRQ